MHVEYWSVGAGAATALGMTTTEISAHLLTDWLPSMPSSMSAVLVGWPPFILEEFDYGGKPYLTIRRIAGQSERQWKGMLSWMLGVAGTRHVLAKEGYLWVAPTSAFYPEAKQAVDLTKWNDAFPPSSALKYSRPLPGTK